MRQKEWWQSIDINKHIGESPLEYHKRIVYGKLVDKTLADIDYTELAELAYGQQYSSDVARRMFYGSKRTLELLDAERKNNIKEDDILSELDRKTIAMREERQRLFDQRRELNKIVSADARKNHIYERIATAAESLNETIGILYDYNTESNSSETHNSNNEAVLVFSDWHFGMKTENIFNKFNTKICKERIQKVTNAAAKRIKFHECSKLHIIVLGDLYHGAIHTGARVASEELVADQLMQVTELLAQSIEYLSRFVKETVVYSTYGNHARTVQNKNDNIHRDNMERIVPWWLNERFANRDNITIMTDKDNELYEFLFVRSCGYNICATHGDKDTIRTATRQLPTLFNKKFGRDIDYILLGDKHHRESFNELCIDAMLCGSLCGTDEYSNDKRLYSEPSQLLLILNPDDGVDAEYHLKC